MSIAWVPMGSPLGSPLDSPLGKWGWKITNGFLGIGFWVEIPTHGTHVSRSTTVQFQIISGTWTTIKNCDGNILVEILL